ncbi:MAG: hypothetical protein M1836_006008 [Candelina mexicana]|nr:MAG: hypothetical protein M1836_006008 [Candelina mexicana]
MAGKRCDTAEAVAGCGPTAAWFDGITNALVSAKLHEEDYPSIIRSIAGVVFLGTPHRGSNSQSKASVIASIASAVSLGEHCNLLKVVDKDSEMLADLLHDFTRTVNTLSIPLFCFFEQHKSDVAKVLKFKGSKMLMPSVKDTVVDEQSGCLDGYPKLGLSTEHFRMNRFSDPEDSNYRLVCEEIVRLVESAPGRVTGRRVSLPLLQASPGEYDAGSYMGSLSGVTMQAPVAFEDRDRASIQALFVTDPADDMEMIANKKDKLLKTTDSWMLNDTTYLKWLNDNRSRVLWLHGDPGKGKTMLAIALIEEFTKKLQLDEKVPDKALLYFFCDNQDDRRKTASHILRGIIYQVLCQHPDLAVYLHNEYEKQQEQLFASRNSLQTLWRIFHTIIKNSGLQEIYIVVDALDECDIDSLETFLVLLEPYIEIEEDYTSQSSQKDAACHMKWLLTSRNEPRIRQPLTGSLAISLEDNASHVDDAVLKFIDVKVKQLTRVKHYDETLRGLVEKNLHQKAEGTFLWVALACRELSKPSVLSVNTEEVLLQLPAGITPLYSRIMDQVLTSSDERSTFYIKSILQSMVVALRPLTLPELAVVAGLPQQYHHNVHVLSEYVEQCGSMVTVRQRQAHFVHLSAKTYLRQAQFIHLSARTHLLENRRESIVSEDLRAEHCNVAIHSFHYICSELQCALNIRDLSPSRVNRSTGNLKTEKIDGTCLEYPYLFWMDHARDASDDIADKFDINAEFFKPASKQRQIWFSAYWAKTHTEHETSPEAFTPMHLAAYAGLSWLLRKLLSSGHSSGIRARDSRGNTPLIWAAKNGYVLAVQLLLDRGSDVAAQNNEGVTALYWAANNGYASIVEQLLRNGANCRPKDKIGWTPLHRAAFNGHTGVIRILLDNNADIEATDSTKWTALMRAATIGSVEVTRLLLSEAANVNVRDMEGCTPLHHAAANGHTEIVKLLLEHGGDLQAKDNESWSVLHHAAWNGHEKTTKYVLKKGADINSRADNGWTALHQATWNGHTAVVGRLLQEGADPDEIDDEGETALHQAAWRGHIAVMSLLLEENADTNMKDRTEQTPLHQAASNGSKAVVQMLLDQGADPRAEDNDGRKPHSLAEENFHHSTAKILRDKETEIYGEEVLPDTDNMPKTSHPGSHLDSAVIAVLSTNRNTATIEPYGQAGFSTPSKIVISVNGNVSTYFMKTGPDGDMFKGEQELKISQALHNEDDSTKRQSRKERPQKALGHYIAFSVSLIVDFTQQEVLTPEFLSVYSSTTFTLLGTVAHNDMKLEMPIHTTGEHESLTAIHSAVPSLCPRPIAHGKLADSTDYFLLTEFIDMEATAGGHSSGLSLAQKLAQLHSSPPPIPKGFNRPVFGFHLMTCVGRTSQNNSWNRSWPKFFAENRLRAVWKTVEKNHGTDSELQNLLDRVVKEVVPRLLGNGHLGGRKGVQPALVHGELWSGNKARGRIGGKGGVEDVTFDPSCCYAHSEYELGIMRMFGGFSAGFFNEYHRLIPKTHPKTEYDDRLSLYELYQWLNHYALFSGGYREDALDCMKSLLQKYGKEEEDDDDSDLS